MQFQSDIDKLIERQQPGQTLEQVFYRSLEIYQLEFRKVLSPQWLYVAHESELPACGDFVTYDIAEDSIIVVRGLDGELVSARHMPSDFQYADYGLHCCQIEVLEGLIFICLDSKDSAEFSQIRDNLLPYLKPHDLARTKVVHQKIYPTYANWKLVVENFRECYHCLPSHPQYTQVNEYVRAAEHDSETYEVTVKKLAEVSQRKGRKSGLGNFPLPIQPHHAWRIPIRDGYKTLTQDGRPAGPLLGEFEEYDGAETGVFIGALSYLYAANDHATTFRFTPKSPELTEVAVSWLVRDDAREWLDYDIEQQKWIWDVTTIQDAKIINNNQKGVNSSRYSAGPYSEHETSTANFISWYLWRLAGRTDTKCPTSEKEVDVLGRIKYK